MRTYMFPELVDTLTLTARIEGRLSLGVGVRKPDPESSGYMTLACAYSLSGSPAADLSALRVRATRRRPPETKSALLSKGLSIDASNIAY
jgi:hypothetical protein